MMRMRFARVYIKGTKEVANVEIVVGVDRRTLK
jgi:hypothetical protein